MANLAQPLILTGAGAWTEQTAQFTPIGHAPIALARTFARNLASIVGMADALASMQVMVSGHGCPNALALRTFGHLLAVLLKILGQVARTNAALPVAGHRVINELWIGQVQVRQNVFELLQDPFFPKPRIAFLFLRDRGNVSVLVVMRRRGNFATCLLQRQPPSDVVGVNVGFQGIG